MSIKFMITTAAALVVLAGPALAGTHGSPKRAYYAQAPGTDASTINGSRGAPEQISGPRQGFEGWPTDYLVNRFGDRQMQGR